MVRYPHPHKFLSRLFRKENSEGEGRELEPTLDWKRYYNVRVMSPSSLHDVIVLLFTFEGYFGNNEGISETAGIKWFVHYIPRI